MMYYGGFGGFGGFWMFGGFLVMIGIVVLAVWLFSSLGRGGRTWDRYDGRPTPNEILRERFARGEISEEEFERAKKTLGPDR